MYLLYVSGSSFITNNYGEILGKADRIGECILIADLELVKARKERIDWGVFRDRRPELYSILLTKDGHTMSGTSN
jgi:N-carbamoylputrescine amidase